MGTDTNDTQTSVATSQRSSVKSSSSSSRSSSTSSKSSLKKIPYPKSVFFIVSNEFCERFSYYGMKAILSFYLTDMLFFSQPEAKIIYHTFVMLVYFFPLLGAMIADSFLGKFRTIFYVSIIYAIGNVILALAATPPLHLPTVGFSMLGLGLIAVGTGGIKPCVAAFGGDQFVLPEQEKQLTAFFSLFYFSINFGSFISTFITPILREQQCFGNDQCFTIAFGVPGALMIVSIIIFGLGRPLYKVRKPAGNMVIEVSKCIGHAIKKKWNSEEKKEHWLDYAEERYGDQLVNDIKATLRVLLLYIPLPVFWALFDQQGTGWTFLARNMDGDLGFYTILPDQMQVINPVLILFFIPLFEYIIYPLLSKMNLLKKPLQRLVCGGVLAAVAFGVSAGVSMAIEAENPVLPKGGEGQLIIYNNYECNLKFAYKFDGANEFSTPEDLINGEFKIFDFEFEKTKALEYKLSDGDCIINNPNALKVELEEEKSIGLLLKGNVIFEDDREKDGNGFPSFRAMSDRELNDVYGIVFEMGGVTVETNTSDPIKHQLPKPHAYTIKVNDQKIDEHDFRLGGVYTVVLNIDETNVENTKMLVFEVTTHNTVHMLWIVPQYVIITMAEIMFSITGLEFSYSQAPGSMKSVLQACWLLTTAFGNLIVVIIESAEIFEKQSLNFFLYAGLMVVDMIIFALMAMRYKYVKKDEDGADDDATPTTDIALKEKQAE